MSDRYAEQIELIKKASSLEEIQGVVRQYPAKASGEGGILYSRPVGNVSSEAIALELAEKSGEPIINSTPRAQFLADKQVEKAIKDSAERIFVAQGQNLSQASKSAGSFLYGDGKALAGSATSLEGSLWGEASREFAGSLRGNVKVVASAATSDRVFGRVEIPEVLNNPKVASLGGQSIPKLQTLYAQGGVEAVLPEVQATFMQAAPKGIFVSPENLGSAVTKVAISSETAAMLGVDAAKFSTVAELTAAGLHRAPTGLSAPTTTLGEAAAVSHGLRPGMAMKGLAVVGTATLAYDFAITGHQVLQLRSEGNMTGAESAERHFVGRNVGGIGGGIATGFLAGAGYGLATGSPTGPGAIATTVIGGVVGGVGGAFLGEKWAQQKDIETVFTQKDNDGNEWHRKPGALKGEWTRSAMTQQLQLGAAVSSGGETPTYRSVTYVAGGNLANELNFKSANASYALGFAHPLMPQDPYSIPPVKSDTQSQSGGGNWIRDSETKAWAREVVTGWLEHGVKISHIETADPQRAMELDQASKLIIAQNAANTPAAMAARYQIAYNQFGWNAYGEVPEAVKSAAQKTSVLQASDGDIYTRGADGEWTKPGAIGRKNTASGNIRDELNGVFQSQQAGLREYSTVAVEALANPTPPKPLSMRDLIADAYAKAGISRTEAQIDAATAAVAATHAREGLDKAGRPYSFELQPDAKTGRPGPNSAIVTMMDDGRDGIFTESKMVPRAITTAEEIKQAEKAKAVGSQLKPGEGANPSEAPKNPPGAPGQRGASLMTDPDHIAHPTWLRAESAMARMQPGALDGLDAQQRERLTAHLAARVLSDTGTGMTDITRIDASTRAHPNTGQPLGLIPGQGDPETAHYKRVAVDIAQAIVIPVERSSDIAKTAMETREQLQAQTLAQTQGLNQDGPGGPAMRMGGRSLSGGEG